LARINQNSISDLLVTIDIVDYISRHLSLKRSGNNYISTCPFHEEKTPSFMVSQEKQIFKCFGCQKSGNLITFVMEYEKYPFYDAIQKLADDYNIILKYDTNKNKDSNLISQFTIRKNLANALSSAADIYADYLKKIDNSHPGNLYLQKRGLNQEMKRVMMNLPLNENMRSLEYSNDMIQWIIDNDNPIIAAGKTIGPNDLLIEALRQSDGDMYEALDRVHTTLEVVYRSQIRNGNLAQMGLG